MLAEERRQAEQEAERQRQDAQAGREAEREAQIQEPKLVDKNLPITRNDLNQVMQQFNDLERAIENKVIPVIKESTKYSENEIPLLTELFDKFESFEIELSGISAQRSNQSIQGTLNIDYMIRNNGNRQMAPAILRDISLKAFREAAGWSRGHW